MVLRLVIRIVSTLTALWLVGCGGTAGASDHSLDDGGKSHPDEGAPDARPDTKSTWPEASIETSAPDAAGPEAAMPDANAPLGLIEFNNEDGFGASFWPDQATDRFPGCSLEIVGPCAIRTCKVESEPPAGSLVSAGTLRLSAPAFGSSPPAVPQNSIGSYQYGLDGGSSTFAPGDAVGASASGAVVPAFGLHTVKFPEPLTLTSPTAPFAISTAADLTVTWSGGQPGNQVYIALIGQDVSVEPAVTDLVTCTFESSAGSGVIPQAALAAVKGVIDGSFNWTQEATRTFAAGEWNIQINANFTMGQSATYP